MHVQYFVYAEDLCFNYSIVIDTEFMSNRSFVKSNVLLICKSNQIVCSIV